MSSGLSQLPPMMDQEREFIFTDRDFQKIASMVYDRVGIHLPPQKKDMVYGRLARRLRGLGLKRFKDYLDYLGSDATDELENLINAVTTNVTGFFREKHHFDHIANKVVPELLRDNHHNNHIRFWSAGCSQGMEAYSLAMVLASMIPDINTWNCRILATDIDTNVLNIGSAGVYDNSQLNKIPPALSARYIRKLDEATFQVTDDVRSIVSFKHLNLLEKWPMTGLFDVIFCRNVVIYFDKPTQRILFDRYADRLKPGGWLYVGHSENLHNISDRFEYQGQTIYRRL